MNTQLLLIVKKANIVRTMNALGYKWFDENKPYNLNIVGIRSNNRVPNLFDDIIYFCFKDDNNQFVECKMEATTDPGLSYLNSPLNKAGCAIMLPGQYRGLFKLGKHQGKYDALVQNGFVRLARDFNKNNLLDWDINVPFDRKEITEDIDFNNNKIKGSYTLTKYLGDKVVYREEQTKAAGIALHRSSSTGGDSNVNKYSAGCQVGNEILKYNYLIKDCKIAAERYGNSFTYTLLTEDQILRYGLKQ